MTKPLKRLLSTLPKDIKKTQNMEVNHIKVESLNIYIKQISTPRQALPC